MTRSQGEGSGLSVEALCQFMGVSRASYYRHWHEHAPKVEETALRDQVQQLKLAPGNSHYGYRRITALLKREGWCVNHKRVARVMREDNLLCLKGRTFRPATTDSRHSWRIWPNLARALEPTAPNQL
jgi:transposase InsO family protein